MAMKKALPSIVLKLSLSTKTKAPPLAMSPSTYPKILTALV